MKINPVSNTVLAVASVALSIFSSEVANALPKNNHVQALGAYVSGDLIYSNPQQKFITKPNGGLLGKWKEGWGGGLSGGYSFNENFRADLGLAYRGKYKYSHSGMGATGAYRTSARADSLALMVNGYATHRFGGEYGAFMQRLKPYVMAGVGASSNKLSDITRGGSNAGAEKGATIRAALAWNVGAGITYDISQAFSMQLGYKYADLGSIKSSGVSALAGSSKAYMLSPSKGRMKLHEVSGGVIWFINSKR